jgi:hypothetical protein
MYQSTHLSVSEYSSYELHSLISASTLMGSMIAVLSSRVKSILRLGPINNTLEREECLSTL